MTSLDGEALDSINYFLRIGHISRVRENSEHYGERTTLFGKMLRK